MKLLSYIAALMRLSLRGSAQNKRVFSTLVVFMFLQNMLMFCIWIIYFHNFRSLKGWQLQDMAALYGIAAFSLGAGFFVCGGAFDLGKVIADGELDMHLGRPHHPLYSLLLRESRANGLGDMLTAPVLWIGFGHMDLSSFMLLLTLSIFAAMIVLATSVIINCLAFAAASTSRGAIDQLLMSFILVSVSPGQKAFPVPVKFLLLTIFPAGFIAYLPVETLHDFRWWKLAAMGFAAFFYFALAIFLFNRGLHRYASGNRLLSVS